MTTAAFEFYSADSFKSAEVMNNRWGDTFTVTVNNDETVTVQVNNGAPENASMRIPQNMWDQIVSFIDKVRM